MYSYTCTFGRNGLAPQSFYIGLRSHGTLALPANRSIMNPATTEFIIASIILILVRYGRYVIMRPINYLSVPGRWENKYLRYAQAIPLLSINVTLLPAFNETTPSSKPTIMSMAPVLVVQAAARNDFHAQNKELASKVLSMAAVASKAAHTAKSARKHRQTTSIQ